MSGTTATSLRLPEFLIVGAMKSGTSTLRDYLIEVPEFFVPKDELHYFSDDHRYELGLDWYASHFEEAKDDQVLGEKTATYSYHADSCARIASDLPDSKLVWIFREPVARTYSHYWHSARNGSEKLGFREAILQEDQRIEQDIWRGYATRSLYVEQIKRYLQNFSRSQMHFLLFEDLVANPSRSIEELARFLGVEAQVELSAKKRSNATHGPRSVRAQYYTRKLFGRGTRVWRAVQILNRRSQPGYPPMDASTRRRLEDQFKQPNQELAALTGLDLSRWESAKSK